MNINVNFVIVPLLLWKTWIKIISLKKIMHNYSYNDIEFHKLSNIQVINNLLWSVHVPRTLSTKLRKMYFFDLPKVRNSLDDVYWVLSRKHPIGYVGNPSGASYNHPINIQPLLLILLNILRICKWNFPLYINYCCMYMTLGK